MAPPTKDDPFALPQAAVAGQRAVAVFAFVWIERLLLIITALLTIVAAGAELVKIYNARSVGLADILLMFLYLEVIGMVAVFYTRIGSPFIYPIFIAITAIARLIVLQGKDMAPEKVVFEAAAILILAAAAVVVSYARRG